MLGLVWLLYASFGVATGTIAPLVSLIVKDLSMTYGQMGIVLGAWQLVYIVTAYPLGILIDRLGVRRSLGIGISVVWLSVVLRGLSVDFYTLFLTVALFGFGGPIISIGAPKVVAVWFQGRSRGVAAGIYTTGPIVGAAIALATAGSFVVPLTGTWRGISLVYGGFVLLVVVIWWILAKDTPTHSVDNTIEEDISLTQTLRTLLQIWNVRIIVILAVTTFLLNHGLNNWLPTILQENDMTLSQAGFWTAISTLLGAFGLLVIPAVARPGYRRLTISILFLMASGSTFGLAIFSEAPMVTSLLVSGMVRAPMMPILTLLLMETPGVGARRMGAAGGIFFAAAEIGGFGGPFLLGILRDSTGSLFFGVSMLAAITIPLVLIVPLIKENRC